MNTKDPPSGRSLRSQEDVLLREREESGVEPFVELRYRRRGRSISRVVALQMRPLNEGIAESFEVFFAVG